MAGIGELITLCSAGVVAVKAGVDAWKERPSEEEKELLIAAAERAEFNVIGLHERIYPVINAGGKIVPKEGDDLAKAKYWDALCCLCKRGAVEHVSRTESGAYLRLSSVGLERARKLAGKDVT